MKLFWKKRWYVRVMFAKIMFTNWRRFLFVSINAFVEVAASITNISCIAHCWLTMAGLTSRNLRSSLSFLLMNTGWIVVLIFKLRSVRRFFTILAETWSLNGMTTRMGAGVVSVDGLCCWSTTLESTNCLTARLNRFLGYLSFKNTVSSRSH